GPGVDVPDCSRRSAGMAGAALKLLGWTGWSPSSESRDFSSLFPNIESPYPVQREVEVLADRLDGPALVVVEAPMGEGKTEAAVFLEDRWGAALGQRGCYFALPTQATSDQMYGRVLEFMKKRYPADLVNLQLLHGHASLSALFQELLRRGEQQRTLAAGLEPRGIAGESGYDGAPAGVVAGEWFTYRKRGLLAPFGVGTIDQALLAALQTRHVFVRLFGLAHKTVILDEVHAYDAYMTALLERLLEWLGALGSSVVLLSATLPDGRRLRLVEAYARGAGYCFDEGEMRAHYPRVSWVSRAGCGARQVGVSTRSTRKLGLEWVDGALPAESEPFALGERLRAELENGGCAAVICNTVARAQQVYLALKTYFPETADDGQPVLDLLHARYLYEDRSKRERRTLIRFGKPDGEVEMEDGNVRKVRRPNRAVLVSTQIIEQSLDLDFDLMVTDLAPVDLLLQRSGR
ncbi:MAG: CRISPR-associated helicase Cas3', partial [Chloroflexi bacterium]|nr:CRISPR-associated helicase Cas3' [Chloroflexota bacterium]